MENEKPESTDAAVVSESEALAVKKLERSMLAPEAVNKDSKSPTIDAFLAANEQVMLLVDTSGSMTLPIDSRSAYAMPLRDADGNSQYKKRIDGLREVVYGIWNDGPVTTIAFGGPYDSQVRFVDLIPDPAGSTPLHSAISLARDYGATRVVVISDGQPDMPHMCFDEAKKSNMKIDVVFVGDPNDSGRKFLQQLANMTGGKEMAGDLANVKLLQRAVVGLLEGGTEERGPIQGAGFTAEAAVPEPEPEPDEPDDDEDDDEEDDDDEGE